MQIEESINIFCSISKARLNEVNDLLIPSLEQQSTKKQLKLYFIDYTGKKTVSKRDIRHNKLDFNILYSDKPLGFGEAHNLAFSQTKPQAKFLIINPDICMDNKCLEELLIAYGPHIGLVEARQLPFTHPKDTPHKHTFQTNWASGCCLLIDSKFFKKVNGFDTNYWMYLEDVDLSWKAWINNYKVVQNPKAIVYHYTGLYFKYSQNSYALEDFWSMRNFLYISYVYFGKKGLAKAKKMVTETQYPKEFVDEAIHNFDQFMKNHTIERMVIPHSCKNNIKIYGYNKFSEHPK